MNRSVLSALALLGVALAGAPASADPVADLLADVAAAPSSAGGAYCNLVNVTGRIDYASPIHVGNPPAATSWTLYTGFTCTGAGYWQGTYELEITGEGSEDCSGGTGQSTSVTGYKTSGPGTGPVVGGDVSFGRKGAHYFLGGRVTFSVHELDNQLVRLYDRETLWYDLPYVPNGGADVTVRAEPRPVPNPLGLDVLPPVAVPVPLVAAEARPVVCHGSSELIRGHGWFGWKGHTVGNAEDAVGEVFDAGLTR